MAKLKIFCGLDGKTKRERMFPPSCHCEDSDEEGEEGGEEEKKPDSGRDNLYNFNPRWPGAPFIPILRF